MTTQPQNTELKPLKLLKWQWSEAVMGNWGLKWIIKNATEMASWKMAEFVFFFWHKTILKVVNGEPWVWVQKPSCVIRLNLHLNLLIEV